MKSLRTRKLPKRVLQECLRDIFFHLFSVFPVVVVIENMHLADGSSLEIIVKLIGASCTALLVATMEPLEDIRAYLFDKNSNSDDVPVPEGKEAFNIDTPIFSRLCLNYRRIIQSKYTLLVPMNDYSILDVEQLLCKVLKLETCPEGISSNIHQLAGGDPFWCRELVQFIEATGTDLTCLVVMRSR